MIRPHKKLPTIVMSVIVTTAGLLPCSGQDIGPHLSSIGTKITEEAKNHRYVTWEDSLITKKIRFTNPLPNPFDNPIADLPTGSLNRNIDTYSSLKEFLQGSLGMSVDGESLMFYLTNSEQPSRLSNNPYINLTKQADAGGRQTRSFEFLLARKIMDSPGKDSLEPHQVLGMAIDVCDGDYWTAMLTVHNLLKEVTYAERGYAQHMKERKEIANPKKLPEEEENARRQFRAVVEINGDKTTTLSPELISGKLKNLRLQGPNEKFYGDKMGPWYHIFGLLFMGGILSSPEAIALGIGEGVLTRGKSTLKASPPDPFKESCNLRAGLWAWWLNKEVKTRSDRDKTGNRLKGKAEINDSPDTLNDTATVEVHVVNATDLKPIAGANVQLGNRETAATDGTASFAGITEGEYRLTVSARTFSTVKAPIYINPALRAVTRGRVKLTWVGATLNTQLRDSVQKTPINGTVKLQLADSTGPVTRETTDGIALFDKIPSGRHRITATADGYFEAKSVCNVDLEKNLEYKHMFDLAKYATLTVTVLDSTSEKPVETGMARITPEGGKDFTDKPLARGKATFALGKARYRCIAEADGYLDKSIVFELDPADSLEYAKTISLDRAATLTVHLKETESRKPLDGTVTLRHESLPTRQTSTTGGKASFDKVATGRYSLVAQATGYDEQSETVQIDGQAGRQNEVTLLLGKPTSAPGRKPGEQPALTTEKPAGSKDNKTAARIKTLRNLLESRLKTLQKCRDKIARIMASAQQAIDTCRDEILREEKEIANIMATAERAMAGFRKQIAETTNETLKKELTMRLEKTAKMVADGSYVDNYYEIPRTGKDNETLGGRRNRQRRLAEAPAKIMAAVASGNASSFGTDGYIYTEKYECLKDWRKWEQEALSYIEKYNNELRELNEPGITPPAAPAETALKTHEIFTKYQDNKKN